MRPFVYKESNENFSVGRRQERNAKDLMWMNLLTLLFSVFLILTKRGFFSSAQQSKGFTLSSCLICQINTELDRSHSFPVDYFRISVN